MLWVSILDPPPRKLKKKFWKLVGACCSSMRRIGSYQLQAERTFFGREAIEELMSVMEDGDPVMIFAGYKDKMEKFLDVNPGLRSRIYRNCVFADYSTEELEEIFHLKAERKGFRVDANVGELLTRQTSET